MISQKTLEFFNKYKVIILCVIILLINLFLICNKKLKLIAHRGYTSKKIKESTKEAYMYAIKYNSDYLEMDIREDKNLNELIIAHDHSKNYKNSLKFKDLFKMIKNNKIGLYIENKEKGLEKKIINLVNKKKLKNQNIVYQSFLNTSINIFKKHTKNDKNTYVLKLSDYVIFKELLGIDLITKKNVGISKYHFLLPSNMLLLLIRQIFCETHIYTLNYYLEFILFDFFGTTGIITDKIDKAKMYKKIRLIIQILLHLFLLFIMYYYKNFIKLFIYPVLFINLYYFLFFIIKKI